MGLVLNFASCLTLLILSLNIGCIDSLVLQRTNKNLQEIIDNTLLVFVVSYDPYCQSQPGLKEFENAAQIAEQNGLRKVLNIEFVKVDVREDSGRDYIFQMVCTRSPQFQLYKYGKVIDYGLRGYSGKVELSDHQRTTKGMFEWLEKETKPSVKITYTEEQLQEFVQNNEFSTTGYFKESSDVRNIFWGIADRLPVYIWGEFVNSSLNPYSEDTIVLNQGFGSTQLILNETLTEKDIEKFVKSNSNSTGPILELTDDNFQHVVDTNLLVFVMFYDPSCPTAAFFDDGARLAAANGMGKYLNMKFAKINIDEGVATRKKYKVSSGCDKSSMEKMRIFQLFRYGKIIPYGTSRIGLMWTQQTFTLNGLVNWMEINTKPSTKIIQSDIQLKEVVEYTEVVIAGYFKKHSKARLDFWNMADRLKDYIFAAITNNLLNPYDVDTIVVYREFGTNQSLLNENLTKETMEEFVKMNANSSVPVPTRAAPTRPPPPPPEVQPGPNIIFIYDKPNFAGNKKKLDLTERCMNVKGNWEQETQSVKTFGQCILLYEGFGCESTGQGSSLLLHSSNVHIQHVLAIAGFQRRMKSIETCVNAENVSSFGNQNRPNSVLNVLMLTFLHVKVATLFLS